MKLIQKLTIISILFISLSTITILLVLNTTSKASYKDVEFEVQQTIMQNYAKIVTQYLEQLDYVLWDWTEWDATYNFIEGNYDDYILDNLPTASYDDFGLDHIAIYREDMSLLYGQTFQEETYELTPLDKGLADLFAKTGETTGILVYEDQLLLYSGKSISDNEGEKPYKGLMVFSYVLDDAFKEKFLDSIGMDANIRRVGQDQTPSSFLPVALEEEQAYNLEVSLSHGTDLPGIGRIEVPYLNENGKLQIEINLGNGIQTLGREHIKNTMTLVLISLLFFGLLMVVAIRFLVIDRVTLLNQQVNKISHAKDIKARVEVKGLDEIGELSEGINIMLEELDKVHDEVHWFANHDEMTGALNRRAGFTSIESALSEIDETGGALTIAYIDIDGLKRVNDNYGHIEGDRLITDMVELLKSCISDQCHIVRIGGDEFIVACRDLDQATTAQKLVTLTEKVEKFNQDNPRPYSLNFSYGLATYEKGMPVDSLIEQADQNMYRNRKVYREKKRDK